MKSSFLIGMYLAAIVAANLLVATFGPTITIASAFIFIALDITARDRLHEAWQGRDLVWKMGMLITTGSALSYALNTAAGPIALASFVAFAVSASLDALTYHLLRENTYLVKVNGSNVIAAAADSLIFPALAFGFPNLWPIVVGQFLAKLIGGALWAWLLQPRRAGEAALLDCEDA
jgi:hypothetical protein